MIDLQSYTSIGVFIVAIFIRYMVALNGGQNKFLSIDWK